MKLALGTVQFGLPYGVANNAGQMPESEVAKVLTYAAECGVQILDTAHLYGSAEEVLGRCLPRGHEFRIVTKTPKFGGLSDTSAGGSLSAAFEESCRRLRVSSLYGLLVHDANDLQGESGAAIWAVMQDLKSNNRVNKIGSSVYSATQIDALIDLYDLDIVQVPLSIVDQRLINSGHLERLASRGVEIHVRSVFLQGALLLPAQRLPSHLAGLAPYVKKLQACSEASGLSCLELALNFACRQQYVDAVVCGVDSLMHFRQLSEALAKQYDFERLLPAESECACLDVRLVDPSKWSRH